MIDTTQIANLAFMVLAAGALIIIGVEVVKLLGRITPTNPAQADMLHALREYAAQAIAAGDALALKSLETAQGDIDGLDRKAIADKFYALLPSTITIAGKSIPIGIVKVFVSQAQWEALVQSVFDELDSLIARNEAWLKAQIKPPVQQSVPPRTPGQLNVIFAPPDARSQAPDSGGYVNAPPKSSAGG